MAAAPGKAGGRILSIQLLRFMAAAIVAYSHVAGGFAFHIADQRGLPFAIADLKLSRVALFFLISGAVLVVACARHYGVAGSYRTFLIRRFTRIFPLYWAATLALIAWAAWLGQPIAPLQAAKSMVLWPFWFDPNAAHPLPILWPAWTLFYELVFYLAFAAALSFPRPKALALVCAILLGLVAAGPFVPVESPPAFMATRPLLMLFVAGMGIGLLLARNIRLPWFVRLGCLIAGCALLVAFPEAFSGQGLEPLGWSYTLALGAPAVLVCLAVAAGPLALPFPRFVDLLGNISYSIFLLHVPIAIVWISLYQKVMPDPGPWGFLVSCLALTLAASWLSFTFFERPLAGWLNRKLSVRLDRPVREADA